MKIVDTNIILRYLLNDNEELNKKATDIIENNEIFVPNEVFVEAMYVLSKTYAFAKKDIKLFIQTFLDEESVIFQNRDIIETTVVTYVAKNLDIVDCMLYAYKKCENHDVETFDKNLNKLLNSVDIVQ